MAIIELQADYSCDSNQLWTIIGDPRRADWVPSVTSCSYDGDCRTLRMEGAGTLVERIFTLDGDRYCIEYGVVQSPVTLEKHQARMQLETTATGTRLHWRTEVLPEQFAGFIKQGMEAGIVGLRALLEST